MTGLAGAVSIVIPALDEAASIGPVVEACRATGAEVLVVDGASSDRTAAIASAAGARVLSQPRHDPGKGRALCLGAEHATGDVLVFIDADGSHRPDDIPSLVEPILAGSADLIVASRLLGGSEEAVGGPGELVRLTGAAFITTCLNLRYGVRLTDSQNGFRAIHRRSFLDLELTARHTTIEQEMLAAALRAGLRVLEVPSLEHRRASGISKVDPARMLPAYLGSLVRALL